MEEELKPIIPGVMWIIIDYVIESPVEEFESQVMTGNLENIKWLDSHYRHISISIAQGFDYLQSACKYGHLEVVKWLVDRFDYDRSVVPTPAFESACVNDNLEIVKFLTEKFNMKQKDIQYYFVTTSDRIQHFRIIKWLVESFDFKKSDFEKCDYFLFRSICFYGNVESIEWIIKRFNFKIENLESSKDCILRLNSYYGNVEFVKWLVETFNFTISEINDCSLQIAFNAEDIGSRHFEIVRYLIEKFDFSSAILKSILTRVLAKYKTDRGKNVNEMVLFLYGCVSARSSW